MNNDFRGNATFTHYKKSIVNHNEVWERKPYENIMWQEEQVVNPSTGFVNSSQVNIYLPFLSYDFQKEDIIVRGIIEDENPNNIKNKYTITSVIPCDYGSENMQHTEIIAK